MGVLDIVDRVGGRLLDGQIQVEIKLGVGLPEIEVEAGGVDGDFLQQGDQGDGLARALGGFDHLAVPDEAHHLHQHHVQAGGIDAQSLQVKKPLERRSTKSLSAPKSVALNQTAPSLS